MRSAARCCSPASGRPRAAAWRSSPRPRSIGWATCARRPGWTSSASSPTSGAMRSPGSAAPARPYSIRRWWAATGRSGAARGRLLLAGPRAKLWRAPARRKGRALSASDLKKAFDLTGRVAVVTGGNGGIGLGMARGMATAGAAIVVAARNRDKSRRAVAELEELGARAIAIDVDVADEASVKALVRDTAERMGRLDILVNNAGINIRKPVHELDLDEWRKVIDTNLTS